MPDFPFVKSRFPSVAYTVMHTTTEKREPRGAARPIGVSVSGKYFAASHVPGMRKMMMDSALCTKETMESPQAQKYPLKQKCPAAKRQSRT